MENHLLSNLKTGIVNVGMLSATPYTAVRDRSEAYRMFMDSCLEHGLVRSYTVGGPTGHVVFAQDIDQAFELPAHTQAVIERIVDDLSSAWFARLDEVDVKFPKEGLARQWAAVLQGQPYVDIVLELQRRGIIKDYTTHGPQRGVTFAWPKAVDQMVDEQALALRERAMALLKQAQELDGIEYDVAQRESHPLRLRPQ